MADPTALLSEKNAKNEDSSDSFCGIMCGKCVGWRGPGTNRKMWKTICTALLLSEFSLYFYMVLDNSFLFFCGLASVLKFLVEIWGQETPTWAAPGTLFMLFVMYGLLYPYVIATYAYCRHEEDFDPLPAQVVGTIMFVLGSSFSLYYELDRFHWKAKPENKGKLHTVGLAAVCIHPNYFGDLFTYTGWALVTGTWCAMACPSFMIWSFAFIVVPNSDAYLASRYPSSFPDYSMQTATLIPGLHSKFVLKALGAMGFLGSCYFGYLCNGACA
mmetsp:Transcript_31356/g.57533  ORF Transcript_31356/g.57533 Transcript_31356/m.57533 type:complete len:272 (-) Transcript_31356:144-959(-)